MNSIPFREGPEVALGCKSSPCTIIVGSTASRDMKNHRLHGTKASRTPPNWQACHAALFSTRQSTWFGGRIKWQGNILRHYQQRSHFLTMIVWLNAKWWQYSRRALFDETSCPRMEYDRMRHGVRSSSHHRHDHHRLGRVLMWCLPFWCRYRGSHHHLLSVVVVVVVVVALLEFVGNRMYTHNIVANSKSELTTAGRSKRNENHGTGFWILDYFWIVFLLSTQPPRPLDPPLYYFFPALWPKWALYVYGCVAFFHDVEYICV